MAHQGQYSLRIISAREIGIQDQVVEQHMFYGIKFYQVLVVRRPLVIVLNDDLRWLLCNEAASLTLLAELQDKRSRLFFVAIEPEESVRVGQSPPQPSVAQSAPPQTPAAGSGM